MIKTFANATKRNYLREKFECFNLEIILRECISDVFFRNGCSVNELRAKKKENCEPQRNDSDEYKTVENYIHLAREKLRSAHISRTKPA